MVQLGEWELIFPTRTLSYPVPQEVPTELGADYREAQLVLRDSKKASAALSRRVLQVVLREKANIKKGDLASEIQQVLDSKQLPTHLAESLDAIRNVGNFAAHPIKSTNSSAILDVEEHESEWLLGTLADLLDFYYVQPAKARARTKAVNAKLQSAGKPPLKTP